MFCGFMMKLDNLNQIPRITCQQCLRPEKTCICHCIQTVNNQTDVLILQFKSEQTHPKNTARLLHLCLSQSRLLVVEEMSESDLQSALYSDNKAPILLYPEDENSHQFQQKQMTKAEQQCRLVIIDGTWRQSRQCLQTHSVLKTLPRFSLPEIYTSQYTMRLAHQSHQLSSLEAACYALGELDGDAKQVAPLLLALKNLNQMQIQLGVLNLKRQS